MKLQIALDTVGLDEARRLLDAVGEWVDIVEVGTPWILREGVRPVTALKREYSRFQILADLKIIDAGAEEARIGYEAGADIVTVLAAAGDVTLREVVQAARRGRAAAMADLIAVPDVRRRAGQLDAWGLDYVCVHTAFDEQRTGGNPLEGLRAVQGVCRQARTAVAGGVKLSTLLPIVELNPEIVVIGGAITGAQDPATVAREMKAAMRRS